MRIVLSLFVLTLPVVACNDLTAPGFPENDVVPFTPPPSYALWWKQVEECSGQQADLSKIRWYQSKGGASLDLADGGRYAGYWWSDGNRIALANPTSGPTVRHEMLHALLKDGTHPLKRFADECAGIVEFEPPEGYGATAADIAAAATAPAETALEVTVSTNPLVPSARQYGGSFSLVVTATNRLSRPVWIDVSGDLLAAAYQNDENVGIGILTGSKRILFLPNQSRRAYVDWRALQGGTILVQGTFLHVSSAISNINIAP